jgi:rhamnose transport system permease protein
MAGAAGIVYVGFFGSARADAADGPLLDVVTAVVLGGIDIFGGAGTMLGVLLALVLVAELRNGMQLANLAGPTQDIVVGGILIASILAGNIIRGVQGRRRPTRTIALRRREVESQPAETAVPVDAQLKPTRGR